MDLYTIYDYERLPLNIEEESLRIVENTKPFFKISDIPGQCVFELFHAPSSLSNWCKSDSNPFGKDHIIFVQKMSQSDKLYPHVDGGFDPEKNIYPRDHAINYLLSESGPTTQWYHTNDPASAYENVVFPSRTWHKIKTDVLHGVINITQPRIAITMIKTWDAETIAKYKHDHSNIN